MSACVICLLGLPMASLSQLKTVGVYGGLVNHSPVASCMIERDQVGGERFATTLFDCFALLDGEEVVVRLDALRLGERHFQRFVARVKDDGVRGAGQAENDSC